MYTVYSIDVWFWPTLHMINGASKPALATPMLRYQCQHASPSMCIQEKQRTTHARGQSPDQSRTKDPGARVKDQGPRIKDQGPRTKDQGSSSQINQGPRTRSIKKEGPHFKRTVQHLHHTQTKGAISVCVWVCVYVCVYVCLCVCMCMCVCA